MKFTKFEYMNKKGFGIVDNQSLIPLLYHGESIPDFFTYIDLNPQNIQRGQPILISEIKQLAPIEYPRRNILCLGKNYREHALEMKGKITEEVVVPDHPIYFSKACYQTLKSGDLITGHVGLSTCVDYEVELAVIIGKQGINISPENVKDHIFGYTIANDLSARDLQKNHYQWLKGKSLEGFCPLGPVIIERDDVAYPPNLQIQCHVNGELRQRSQTAYLIFDIDFIISDLSKGMRLLPGDIILTGTPSGVGMGFEPPKYLVSGDVITCEIESIGQLVSILK